MTSDDEVIAATKAHFESKNKDFIKHGIEKLKKRIAFFEHFQKSKGRKTNKKVFPGVP